VQRDAARVFLRPGRDERRPDAVPLGLQLRRRRGRADYVPERLLLPTGREYRDAVLDILQGRA
jgi:hypothetical protein